MANAISGAFFAGVALKSTVLLCGAWIAVWLMRRSSAALRHLVWSMAFASLLVLPLISAWLPALRLPVSSSVLPAGLLFKIDAQPHPYEGTVAPQSMPKNGADSQRPINWGLLSTFAWAGGVVLSLAQMLIGIAVIERRRRTAKPLDITEAAIIARQLGLQTPVNLLKAEAGSMPMTYGFRRPAIFLPADAVTWDPERLRFVLLHELAHVRRRDGALHLVARTALAFYWWNPLAWSAWREFLKERERAADDLVLSLGTRASDYASQLLEIASCMQATPAFAWAGVPMARRSQLESRLSAILDSGCNRKAVERVSTVAVSLSALLILLPVAAVHAKNGLPQASAANSDSAHPVTSALLKQADEAREQHKLDQARTLYTQALAISGGGSETAALLIRLGTLELSAKNYEQSITDFDKAQSADGDKTAEARMWMAIARERENNSDAADVLFQSALPLRPLTPYRPPSS